MESENKKRKIVIVVLIIICILTVMAMGVSKWLNTKKTTPESEKRTTIYHAKQDSSSATPKESKRNVAELESQLKRFVPLYYNQDLSKDQGDKLNDYITAVMRNRIHKNQEKHESYEDNSSSLTLSGLSFFIPLEEDVTNQSTVRVLTAFQSTIKSDHAPEIRRNILVELTVKFTDTWRVDQVTDKSELGGVEN